MRPAQFLVFFASITFGLAYPHPFGLQSGKNEVIIRRSMFPNDTAGYARAVHELAAELVADGFFADDVWVGEYKDDDDDDDDVEARSVAKNVAASPTANKAVQGAKLGKEAIGLIQDGVGLATDIATGDVPKAIFDAIKLTVDAIVAIFHAIQAAKRHADEVRVKFLTDSLATCLQKHPKLNFILVHTDHKPMFNGDRGKKWTHEHRELNVAFPLPHSTIGFEVYGFVDGEFLLTGDGGATNWQFGSNFEERKHGEHHLYFNAIGQPQPKGHYK
jgi:hypothetical protein